MSFWRFEKVDRRALYSQWVVNRIRWIATVVGAYSSICALATILLAIALLLVVSLIPLYLNKHGNEAVGELYCINNYSIIVGFQIPQYNTTFTATMTSATYTVASGPTQYSPNVYNCLGPININSSENLVATDSCTFQLLSIIYPATPNARVFNNYALSEACYQTLQTCYYDPLLTSCLLSNCVAEQVVGSTGSASYPLTNYRVLCTANIYYNARCSDSPASYHLYYSSSQQNSACRQQRLNRINTCLNSTVQLLNVPCLISVSSGIVTSTMATCTQSISTNPFQLTFSDKYTNTSSVAPTTNNVGNSLTVTFTSTAFSATDQANGHVYRISSVNSETYNSSQLGALYCGSVTLTQIASSITAAIYSQTS